MTGSPRVQFDTGFAQKQCTLYAYILINNTYSSFQPTSSPVSDMAKFNLFNFYILICLSNSHTVIHKFGYALSFSSYFWDIRRFQTPPFQNIILIRAPLPHPRAHCPHTAAVFCYFCFIRLQSSCLRQKLPANTSALLNLPLFISPLWKKDSSQTANLRPLPPWAHFTHSTSCNLQALLTASKYNPIKD